MKKRRSHWYPVLFTIGLLAFSSYALLDTFVIPHSITSVRAETVDGEESEVAENVETAEADGDTERTQNEATAGAETTKENAEDTTESTAETADASESATITDTSYKDDNISIQLQTIEKYDTTVYVADVQVSSPEYLKTALAHDTYGTNITETTSSQAEDKGAILAINGDYYGANRSGYVIRNGEVYRDTQREDGEDLAIYKDGSFAIIQESEVSAQELADQSVTQLLAFGPALVKDGEIAVDENTEVGKAMASNPRTAIGIIDDCHYIIVVADGRSQESAGLSLYELAGIMQDYGCTTAYNLDGGGSSTLYFNGQVINNPTTNGHSFKEREVSDIVYIGY